MLYRIMISLIPLLFLTACTDETREEKDARLCDDEIGAFVMATQFVEPKLRSPSTADFPYYSERDQGLLVTTEPGCNFSVLGYVDAQNGFGGTVRQRWIVKLKYVGDDKYRLTDIAFE